jgi:hypothetical protein
MSTFSDNTLYPSFRDAADAWLERWNMLQGGCLHLSRNLSDFPVETREEWKNMALSFITTYHCGKCDFDFINRIHKLIVRRILEDIQAVEKGSELKWRIKPPQRRKRRKKRPDLYQNPTANK